METPREPGVSMKDVFDIISQMNDDNQKNILLAIQEMKKPTEAEQKKIDAENAKLKSQQEARLKLAQADEQRKEMRSRSCSHSTVHPGTGVVKHAWRAQVHTPDGEPAYFVPTCMQCWTQGPKIKATMDQVKNGVNLDQYVGIDLERLKLWAQQMEHTAA